MGFNLLFKTAIQKAAEDLAYEIESRFHTYPEHSRAKYIKSMRSNLYLTVYFRKGIFAWAIVGIKVSSTLNRNQKTANRWIFLRKMARS